MLETNAHVVSKVWTNINFHLKRFVNLWEWPHSTLLSLMREFKFHFASFMAVMNVLTSWTEFVYLSETGTILTLYTHFSLWFIHGDIERFHDGWCCLWKFIKDDLKILYIIFLTFVKEFLVSFDTANNQRLNLLVRIVWMFNYTDQVLRSLLERELLKSLEILVGSEMKCPLWLGWWSHSGKINLFVL